MNQEIVQLVTERCLHVEETLIAKIDELARIIEGALATKEDVSSLQKQINELRES